MVQRSVIISLTIPPDLLEQVDTFARQDYETRSGLIRRALREYITSKHAARSVVTAADFNEIRKKYPYIDPNDTGMLQLIKELDES
jgi:hypothetical protein